jgi:hypothetical protein
MINHDTFTLQHIQNIRQNSKRDPALIERCIFAFGLLEAIQRSGLPFIFKGGTSLMLLMDEPQRFSTDIDLLVAPGTELDTHLATVAKIWPFIKKTEQIRKAKSGIEKQHFKFYYQSPLTGKEMSIMLDVVFEENQYSQTVQREIKNDLLLTETPPVYIEMPNADGLAADKLTAFAPNTTGIPYNEDREVEIIKQLFDISVLMPHIENFIEVKETYSRLVRTELSYRNLSCSATDVLADSIRTAAIVAGRGIISKDDYIMLKKGISNIRNHIYSEDFNGETAVLRACMVMLFAAAILTDQSDLPAFKDDDYYLATAIPASEYQRLGYIKKTNLEAYKYLVEAVLLLQ